MRSAVSASLDDDGAYLADGDAEGREERSGCARGADGGATDASPDAI